MEVVKYIRFEENGGEINLYFKICEGLAEFVRKKTNLCEKALNLYLDKDNLFCYTISRTDNFEDIRQSLVETIERISNESDDVRFYKHLITDDGRPRFPRDIHSLMHEEYGLVDINEAENDENDDSNDFDLEWWTAHFFIEFGRLLFDKKDEFFDSDDEAGMIRTAASVSEISSLLEKIKSIDSIIIVDDVRKYGPGDIKRLREEMDLETEEDKEHEGHE